MFPLHTFIAANVSMTECPKCDIFLGNVYDRCANCKLMESSLSVGACLVILCFFVLSVLFLLLNTDFHVSTPLFLMSAFFTYK